MYIYIYKPHSGRACNKGRLYTYMDYAKCFDRLPQQILFKLAEEMGLPTAIAAPLRTTYAQLRRRTKFSGYIGGEYAATNGILQGCPLSVVLLNALLSIWMRAVEAEVPEAMPKAYVDDTYITASRPKHINAALEVTGEFVNLTGQQLKVEKCKGFSTTTAKMRPLMVGDARLKQVHSLNAVGSEIVTNPAEVERKYSDRVEGARQMTRMLRWARLPWSIRADLLATMALPSGLYGSTVAAIERRQYASWRQEALMALLGPRRGRHCAEIVFSLLTPGHRTDPVQARKFQSLSSICIAC